jgi:hypothetical protein
VEGQYDFTALRINLKQAEDNEGRPLGQIASNVPGIAQMYHGANEDDDLLPWLTIYIVGEDTKIIDWTPYLEFDRNKKSIGLGGFGEV